MRVAGERIGDNPRAAAVRDLARARPFGRRIVLGSFWEEDGSILLDAGLVRDIAEGRTLLVVVPHRLDGEDLGRIHRRLESLLGPSCPIYRTETTWDRSRLGELYTRRPGVVLFCEKGILLELYTLFDTVFVGGGYGGGVHSLLEPFIAGAGVFCGPNTSRSTEYDLVRSLDPGGAVRLEQPESFYALVCGPPFDGRGSVGENTSMDKRYGQVLREMAKRTGMDL